MVRNNGKKLSGRSAGNDNVILTRRSGDRPHDRSDATALQL